MKYNLLANTDIKLSAIGLGTVKFGRNQGVKYPNSFLLPTDSEIVSLLECSFDLGINVIDTAPAYGVSETKIGLLRPHSRDKWVISTKVGEYFHNNQSHYDFSESSTRNSIDNSLKHLNTDYLDIVFIHSNGDDTRILKDEAVLDTLLDLKSKGIIRAIGMSTKTVDGGLLAYSKGCDAVMLTYNPDYTTELPVIKEAKKLNKSVFIKKAFSSGHFSPQTSTSPINETIQFVFKEPNISCVVIGTLSQKHLKENVLALSNVKG